MEPGITRTNLKVSFKDRIKNLQKDSAKEDKSSSFESADVKQHLIPSTSTTKPRKPSTTQQIKDKFRSFGQIPKDELTPWSKLKLATVVSLGGSYSSLNNSIAEDSPKLSKTAIKSSMPIDLNAVNKFHASLTSENVKIHQVEQESSVSDSDLKNMNDTNAIPKKIKRKPKPFKILSEHKDYRSVDDLSPEYGGLPFVKKLKILNERQKLAELESVIQTRSFSLDCTDSSNSNEMVEVLTRSHSEASCMTRPKLNATSLGTPIAPLNIISQYPIKSPLSPESNETLERKQLKSILKKLSEDRLSQNAVSKDEENRHEMKRLMRAQTVEGYVARRTKFTKSVTFNNTLSSPPNSAILTEETDESSKSLPTILAYPTKALSPLPITNHALYPISHAQNVSSSIESSPNHTLEQTPHESEQSTNRFNYSDDMMAVSSPPNSMNELCENISPETPITGIDDNASRRFSFVSDDNGQKKLVKGI